LIFSKDKNIKEVPFLQLEWKLKWKS